MPSSLILSVLVCFLAITADGEEENYDIIDTTNPCEKEIDLYRANGPSVHAGEVNANWWFEDWMFRQNKPCRLWFSGNYLFDRLAFQFTKIDIEPEDCIYINQRGNFSFSFGDMTAVKDKDGSPLHYCGSQGSDNRLSHVHTTDSEQNLYIDFKMGTSGKKKIRIVYNVFHMDETGCDDYLCDNGRCIPDDIQCNKYNPCGDESSCNRLTGWEIFGIVVAGIFGAILVGGCCCYCYYQCKESQDETSIDDIDTNVPVEESYPLNAPVSQDEGVNSTQVFVYATVSNQTNSDGPPTYTTLTNHRTDTTPSHGHLSGQTVEPSAPYFGDSSPTVPPPPSYSDVMEQEHKYKVTL